MNRKLETPHGKPKGRKRQDPGERNDGPKAHEATEREKRAAHRPLHFLQDRREASTLESGLVGTSGDSLFRSD